MDAKREVAKRIARRMREVKGWTAWFAGGFVRDWMMGKTSHDMDIVVEGATSGQEISEFMKAEFGSHCGEFGKRFGVVKCEVDGFDFDFCPPRAENKVAAGKKGFEVEFMTGAAAMVKDSNRRDFTFNSAFERVEDGFVFDPNGAAEAITKGEVKATSVAFVEDPTRVFRGARFSARFGFKAHPFTVEMAEVCKAEFDTIESDMIFNEFKKWAKQSSVRRGNFWRFMAEVGWMGFFSEVEKAGVERVAEACDRVEVKVSPDAEDAEWDAFVIVFAAMKDAGVDVKAMMKRMGRSDWAVRKVMDFGKPAKFVEGRDVIAMGVEPGPEVGRVVNAVFAAQVAGEVKSREDAMAMARSIVEAGV